MKKIAFIFAFSLFVLASCNNDNVTQDNFDRKAMLQDVAQTLIKPAFATLRNKVDSVVTLSAIFVQTPNLENLIKLQKIWENAYLSYQNATAYNFGAAGEEGIRKSLQEEIATFPAKIDSIESVITKNNANFNNFQRDARGFLALEYLLFDLAGNHSQIVTKFAEANRKTFLTGLVGNLKTRIDAVATSWEGSYMQDFINNDGTSAGSSVSLLYNEFVKSFEFMKNYKVATPLGKRAGLTRTYPELVEAYYSGKSIKMLKAHLNTLETLWRKFIPYLQSVEGGNALISATEAQLASTKNALNAVAETPSFSAQIIASPASFDVLNTEFQKLTPHFKSSMSSLLGIAITYASGDGD